MMQLLPYAALAQILPASTNPLYAQLFMYGMFALIFWFVLWRPQQKQKSDHAALLAAIKKDDEIVTAGGIIGTVVHIKQVKSDTVSGDDRVTIKSGEARLVVARGRITGITSGGVTSGGVTA